MIICSRDLIQLTRVYERLCETKRFLDQVAEEFIDAETVEMHTVADGNYCVVVTYDAKRFNRLSKIEAEKLDH